MGFEVLPIRFYYNFHASWIWLFCRIKILIEATDNDVLRPRKANTVLLLNVDDVNDNDPVISINFIAEHKNNIGTYIVSLYQYLRI